MKILLCIFFIITVITSSSANDFSSFLTVNASLAVVIDDNYMQSRNESLMAQIQKIVDDVVRENLKNGGVNVKFFNWIGVTLEKDFIAAIVVTDCANTWSFFEAASKNSISVLAVTDSSCPRLPVDKAIMIPLTEKGSEIPQLLLDMKIQKLLNWKSCILLFDSSIEDKSAHVISSLAHKSVHKFFNPISVYLYKLNDKLLDNKKREYITETLSSFINVEDSNFVVFSKSVEDVLEIASNMGMLNVFNRWLFFILSSETNISHIFSLTQRLNEGANIAFALNKTVEICEESILCSVTEMVQGFILGLSKVIKGEQALYGAISDEEWEAIRLTKSERQDALLAYMQLYLKSNQKCSSCSKWEFETIVSWGKSGRYTKNIQRIESVDQFNYDFLKAGVWTPISGFLLQEKLFPHSEEKFRNLTLKIGTYNNPPWQILSKNAKGEVVDAEGIVMEIVKELSHRLNFTYKLYDLGDEKNYQIPLTQDVYLPDGHTNNIPSKLKSALESNSLFMAAIAATIDDDYVGTFNFTIPISVQSYSFLTRRPDEVNRIYLFTAPFTAMTWICLILATMFVPPVLYLVNIYSPLDTLKTSGLTKMKNCFWYVYGALLQQGGMYLPKADSGRVIVGVWWMVVIVIVTTYCGSLVAFLTFPKFQPSIQYLREVFDHKEITKFGLKNGTFFAKYVAKSTRPELVEYVKRSMPYNSLTDNDIDAIKKGDRVNVDWKVNLQLIIRKQFEDTKECDFMLGNEEFVDEQIGLLFPQGSPYLDLINRELRLFKIMGFIHKWHADYYPMVNKCGKMRTSRQIVNHTVNIYDMQGCFLVLLFGFVASFFIIIFELLVHKFITRKHKFPIFTN